MQPTNAGRCNHIITIKVLKVILGHTDLNGVRSPVTLIHFAPAKALAVRCNHHH